MAEPLTDLPNELTDAQYEAADKICRYLEDRPTRDFTASQLARVAGIATWEAHVILDHLIRHHDGVLPSGRGGMWRRYKHRPLHAPIH